MPATTPLPAAAAPRRGCTATKANGELCRGFAQVDSTFCLAHDPSRREAAQAARAKGARKGNVLRSIQGRRRKLDTAPALVNFTSGLLQDLLDGTLSPDVARALFYGVSIQRSLVEVSDLDARLKVLEAQQQKGPMGRWGT